MLVDVIRYALVSLFGVGLAFMLATNYIAFRVLRPPKMLGFLWWHVTAISVSFLCLGSVALLNTVSKIGEPPTWQLPVSFFGFSLFAVAQIIIFNVERSRWAQKRALEQAITGGT